MKQKRVFLASPKKTNLALLAGAVILPFLAWNYAVSPSLAGLAEAQDAQTSANQALAAAVAEAETLNLVQDQKVELEEKLRILEAKLPKELDTSTILAEIQATALPATVENITFGVPALPVEPELSAIPGLHQVPVTVRLTGDALSLLGYPERLTNLSSLIVVDATSFTPPEGGWGRETATGYMEIAARTWVMLTPPETGTEAAPGTAVDSATAP